MSESSDFLFSVIVSTYNVELWIEAFFVSLEGQSFDFRKHVQVIIVDDGSTDNSARIAKRWTRKYPATISYHYKENGGLASARNFGLQYARGQWVTFADPDDLLEPTYFEEVAKVIDGFTGTAIACNIIYLDNASSELRDAHPLRYKFQHGATTVNLLEQEDCIQLSAASLFIRGDVLRASGMRFDERVKPSFEDAHFLNLFFAYTGNYTLGIAPSARYLYRQSSNSGLVATGWKRKEKYLHQIIYGYQGLLRAYQEKTGGIPAFVQNTVIYDLHGYIERMAEGRIPFHFTPLELASFWDALRTTLALIDPVQILAGALPSVPLRTRMILLAIKGVSFNAAPCTLLELNSTVSQAHLLHWSAEPQQLFLEDGKGGRTPLEGKHVTVNFADTLLCHGQYVWVPLRYGSAARVALEDGTPLEIVCGSAVFTTLERRTMQQQLFAPLSMMPETLQALYKEAQGPEAAQKYDGCWLLMDRVHKADDNAEHLYRWLRAQPEFTRPLYFVLTPDSPDWERLESDGFALLPYGSNHHAMALFRAEWLISSNAEGRVFDALRTKFFFGLPRHKFAFLQHGITKDDLSTYMNGVPADLFVTSTAQEYESVLGGSYKFTRREVVLTGFPRHDTLLAKAAARPPRRLLAFCPTWRQYLYGTEAHIPGLDAEEAARFMQSDYFKAWNAVTASTRLARLAQEHGYELVFFPHPLVSRFVPLFANAGAFSFKEYNAVRSVQDILVDAALLVTDYSSIAMDAALLGRPVAYYQFQETPAFFDSHLYTKGYFEYSRDGFGPVQPDMEGLIAYLEAQMSRDCRREAVYEERAERFFTLKDGQSCKRTYEAILERS